MIEPGKRADLVIVRGDALDIDDLGQRIRTVVQDGKVVVENADLRSGEWFDVDDLAALT